MQHLLDPHRLAHHKHAGQPVPRAFGGLSNDTKTDHFHLHLDYNRIGSSAKSQQRQIDGRSLRSDRPRTRAAGTGRVEQRGGSAVDQMAVGARRRARGSEGLDHEGTKRREDHKARRSRSSPPQRQPSHASCFAHFESLRVFAIQIPCAPPALDASNRVATAQQNCLRMQVGVICGETLGRGRFQEIVIRRDEHEGW